ncbi:MAG: hypothetical protein LBU61_02985, partial [Coriobacteriales bacterium]|nr:hypothetical protein [Coriobacteriales bacterium]
MSNDKLPISQPTDTPVAMPSSRPTGTKNLAELPNLENRKPSKKPAKIKPSKKSRRTRNTFVFLSFLMLLAVGALVWFGYQYLLPIII